jgi:predicted acylesterase/phospholipase RssA
VRSITSFFRPLAPFLAAAAFAGLAGCQTLTRLPSEPAEAVATAEPDIAGCLPPSDLPTAPKPGDDLSRLDQCRFLPARDVAAYAAEARASLRREMAWRRSQGETGPPPPMSMLAISGGGDDGAFGAGLLVGWSESGTRPEFKLVTGVSTGALIAPYAFLGSRYDPQLKTAYTQVSQRDIFKPRGFLKGFFSDALSDTSPLARKLEREVTQQMLDDIAAEYAKGRLLLIGTSDLDAMEPVIWNMTAIAASHDPHALTLFRRILLASASIPGAFPPVMIDVNAGGQRYQEMHVDGGAEAQVFVYPPSIRITEAAEAMGVQRQRSLYVIRNSRMDAEEVTVKRSTMTIATRSISALLASQGVGDLYRIYFLAERDGLDYNLAYIPSDFTAKRATGQFDQAYMNALFEHARELGRAGYPWQKYPPGYTAPPRGESARR